MGAQVTDAYDFTAMIDRLTQLAPTTSFYWDRKLSGGAVAHVVITEQWQGIQSKDDFIARQKEDPFVLAMGRTDQRVLVTQ